MDRVLDTLRRDERLSGMVTGAGGAFRFGELPIPTDTLNTLPLVYVASSPSPLLERQSVGGAPGGTAPRELVTYSIHVVCVNQPEGEDPFEAQRRSLDLADAVVRALSGNLYLVDADGGDPLSHNVQMSTTRRYMGSIGTSVEATTVMCSIITNESYQD